MRTLVYYCLLPALLAAGCYSPNKPDPKKKKATFVFKETIATGRDTGMKRLSGFRTIDIRDQISQHWELEKAEHASSIELTLDEDNIRIFPELNLFKDGQVLENPRSHFRTGTWQVKVVDDQPLLMLHFPGHEEKQYLIQQIESHNLYLVARGAKNNSLYLRLTSDALVHQNMLNDPLHPSNNQWRIAPAQSETDSAIKARVLQCIKFYALYFRDNIKRKKQEINFMGFPKIFQWYRRGIGLPDKEDIHSSWIKCFYNKEQAIKGYNVLRTLIVNYEFDWPKAAPNWLYETHSVLEQMYHKLNTRLQVRNTK
jgi:hypothetical protein